MKEMGLFGLMVPEAFGDIRAYGVATAEKVGVVALPVTDLVHGHSLAHERAHMRDRAQRRVGEAEWEHRRRMAVEHALNVFGEDRVLFGSDWPVVTQAATYQRWVETVEAITRDFSDEQKDKLWRQNAVRFYRLDDEGS